MNLRFKNLAGCVLLLAAGLPAHAALDGAMLYERHCAACHGIEGRGGVGVPLALPAFLNSVTDRFLAKSIRLGRPGRVMPSFDDLSDAQINAIVRHIRGWSATKEVQLPEEAVQGDTKRGKALYMSHCASCHGENGGGGTGTGVTFSRPRELPIIAPALNNPGFLAAASDQMVKQTLMKGREGTPMASFLDQGLSEQDIDDVVAYIRSFEEHPPGGLSQAEETSPLLIAESPYGLKETVENVKRAAVGKNFRIIRVQTLDAGLVPEGREDQNRIIVYFCNFNFLNDALAIDPRVGMFLPCRVTVVKTGETVKIISINPKHLSRLFNNVELDRACSEMHDIYQGILEEATL